MSVLGHSRRFWPIPATSALPPLATVRAMSAIHPIATAERTSREVRSVPEADIAAYSITSSARASTDGGSVRPIALAVFRLTTSSYRVGTCTGRSAGFSPLRMRST